MKGRLLILIAIAINNFGDILFDLFVAWGLSINTGSFMGAVYVIGTSVGFRAFKEKTNNRFSLCFHSYHRTIWNAVVLYSKPHYHWCNICPVK